MANPTKELTYEERATWGECAVCHAGHGEKCDPNVGISLGRNSAGLPPTDGAHLRRLQEAPFAVELRPISERAFVGTSPKIGEAR